MILSVYIATETETRLRHAANNHAGELNPPEGEEAMTRRMELLAEALVAEGALDWAKKNGGPV